VIGDAYRRARLALAGTALLLAACTGGGSSNGGDNSVPLLSVSTSSINFTANHNAAAPAPQAIGVSINGGSLFAAIASVTGTGFSASFRVNNETTGTITVTPDAPTMAPGTYTGTITLRGCTDALCIGGDVAGSPRVIGVSYAIQPAGLAASPPSLNFSQPEGGAAPAAQVVTISEISGSSYPWTASILYGLASGWLSVNSKSDASGPSLPGLISVEVAPALPVGTYVATVRITGSSNTTDVPVTYVISKSLSPSPGSLSYTIGNAPLPADLTRQISVNAFPGVTWTAASNASWLNVSPSSGGSGDSLSASLVQSEVDAKNNGTYLGTVTLTPSVGPVATLPVTLTIARTQVNWVAPYVAVVNKQNEVAIRGENFDRVTVTNVKFGSAPAVLFVPVSSTEIRATHPGLAPGTYAVQVETSQGTARSLANNLVAVDPTSYTAATIAYPNATAKQPLEIIYDAERQALLVGVAYPTPGSSGEIFRYAFTSPAWAATPASATVTTFRDLALSLDGKQLLALGDVAVQQIDPTSLATGVTTPAILFQFGLFFKGIAVANDGNAVLSSGFLRGGASPLWLYSVRDPKVTLGTSTVFGTPGASADGSRVVLTQGDPQFPNLNVAQYNSADGLFSFSNFTVAQNGIRPKLDRKATRILLNGSIVVDSGYSVLGNLPEVAPGTTAAAALSPDGTRAYQYVSGTAVHAYNLAAAPVGPTFPEIAGATLPSDPGANPVMTVSPDGGTLFIAGSDAIVVVPAP
jgi:IPT/TIG domain-containing protein